MEWKTVRLLKVGEAWRWRVPRPPFVCCLCFCGRRRRGHHVFPAKTHPAFPLSTPNGCFATFVTRTRPSFAIPNAFPALKRLARFAESPPSSVTRVSIVRFPVFAAVRKRAACSPYPRTHECKPVFCSNPAFFFSRSCRFSRFRPGRFDSHAQADCGQRPPRCGGEGGRLRAPGSKQSRFVFCSCLAVPWTLAEAAISILSDVGGNAYVTTVGMWGSMKLTKLFENCKNDRNAIFLPVYSLHSRVTLRESDLDQNHSLAGNVPS